MFSNIDPFLALHLVEGKWNLLNDRTTLNFVQFDDAVHFCNNNIYFQFNHNFYKQNLIHPWNHQLHPLQQN